MATASSRTPLDDEDLYDRYLDAALGGRLEDPDIFLARYPDAGRTLRDRLNGLRRMILGGTGPAGAAAPPEPAPISAAEGLPFERLGGFRLLRQLDVGGMGAVYLAEDEALSRLVAVKIVRPELRSSPHALERFRREALAVARLSHPNIVNLYSVGEQDGVAFLAMEYVPGKRLDEVLDDAARAGGRLPVARVVDWGIALAEGLACAHEAGVVHRDVKPPNVMIRPDGRPVLLDFGIARAEGTASATLTGPFLGSPVYAAPEQIGGSHEVGPHTDVHALGATLHECLTGRPPFDGGTTDRVFHRILTEQPESARRANPAVPQDLALIVLTALEKEPGRRYATARSMADDLRAFREFRPIAARAPGLPTRARKWARRHPALAAAGVTACVLAVTFAWIAAHDARTRRRTRRIEAAGLVRDANERIEDFARRREHVRETERAAAILRRSVRDSWLTPEQDADLDRIDGELADYRRRQESVFYEVLEFLDRAERLDPAVEGVTSAKAALYAQKHLAAKAGLDPEAAAFYRRLVLETEPDGPSAAEVAGLGTLRLTLDPPDAEVHLFRLVEHREVVAGGESRIVPVPLRGPDPLVPPGARCAEVVAPSGGLLAGDLLLSIGGVDVADLGVAAVREHARVGGSVARLWRAGAVLEIGLTPNASLLCTAAPLPCSPLSQIDPRMPPKLPEGGYLLVARRTGCDPVRRWFTSVRGKVADVSVTLATAGTLPPGFVRVHGYPDGRVEPFLIMQREVTSGEYLAYLNEESTLVEIAAADRPIRFPRVGNNASTGGFWPRGAEGRFRLPDEWPADWPVFAVSHDDAAAYARWKGPQYGLPTFEQWVAAGTSPLRSDYVHGFAFRPKWVKSCFARPRADPEPVLSYPVDQSVSGVFDLSGSVQEWSADPYPAQPGSMRVTGGSWATGEPEHFRLWADSYAAPDHTSTLIGFRLVRDGADPR